MILREGRWPSGRGPEGGGAAGRAELEPSPEAVTDEAFSASEFLDARDLVQVKYEMVRRVRVDGRDGEPVGGRASGSPARRSTRRPQPSTTGGLAALVPARPARGGRTSSPTRSSPSAGPLSEDEPRCARRIWRPWSRSVSGSGAPTLGRTGAGAPASPKVRPVTGPAGDSAMTAERYEELRRGRSPDEADGHRLGLAVLLPPGVAAWLQAWRRHRRGPATPRPAPGRLAGGDGGGERSAVLAAMALACRGRLSR